MNQTLVAAAMVVVTQLPPGLSFDPWHAVLLARHEVAIVEAPKPKPVSTPVSTQHQTATGTAAPIPPDSVAVWRPLVEQHFPPGEVANALSIIWCESRGDPTAVNPTSQAAGLFQAMPQWYTGVGFTQPSPYGPFDPFDPAANVAFAAWLFDQTPRGWSKWQCRP